MKNGNGNGSIRTVAVLVTIILALMALSFGYGVLNNKVSSNSGDIADIKSEIRAFIKESKVDRQIILDKLDDVIQGRR